MAIRISKPFADLLYQKVSASQYPDTDAARDGQPGIFGHHEMVTLALCSEVVRDVVPLVGAKWLAVDVTLQPQVLDLPIGADAPAAQIPWRSVP